MLIPSKNRSRKNDFLFLGAFRRPTKNVQMDEFTQISLVELPDTASGSELSHGYHSTHIVFCFVLAEYKKLQKTKLSKAIADCRTTKRHVSSRIPVIW